MIAFRFFQIFIASLPGLLSNFTLAGQTFSLKYDLADLCNKNQIESYNSQIHPLCEGDKRGISISKSPEGGFAWLKGVEFSNGIIEIYIRDTDISRSSVVGIAFHGINNDTLDLVYFCPYNFLSSDPEINPESVRYASHPEFQWHYPLEENEDRYENGLISVPGDTDWYHIKIDVQYPDITVYLNGSDIPVLDIKKMNTRRSGRIGFWAGKNSDGDFANLVISTIRRMQR
jgi:hypothetical protein